MKPCVRVPAPNMGRFLGSPMPAMADVLLVLVLASLLQRYVLTASPVPEDRALYLVLTEGDPLGINAATSETQAQRIVESHDRILQSSLDAGEYRKLYSFRHVVNGFAVHTTPSQAKRLESVQGVTLVEKDRGVKPMTTYTPRFLGLPGRIWARQGGPENAGEGIVIGFVDTGIDPTHPSFAYIPPTRNDTDDEYWDPRRFGPCDVGRMFPIGSCNGKIVSARHFWAGAATTLPIGPIKDLSPFDDSGHGTHVASVAAGNHGIPVVVNGFNYGYASGMAPAARIAVYKALYPQGGTLADIVAAVDQATRDGVDVLTLSIGPDYPPSEKPIFLNVFDIMLLFARRAGIFVAQAAGNRGPGPSSVISYSPWTVTVGATSTNRVYTSTLLLGNHTQVRGVGLSGPTFGNGLLQFKLVAARDAMVTNGNLSITPQYAEECQHPEALQPLIVRGSVVICNFSYGFVNGTSSIINILETARALGFMGFILVANPVFGSFIAEPLPLTMPAVIIPSVTNVKIIMEYYEKQTRRDSRGNVVKYGGRASIGEGRIPSFRGGPVVARFSSRGPDIIDDLMNPADVLKPDLAAPGHQIWGAWSPISARNPFLRGYNFALMSGTSMATPHVTGIAALIKQSRPSWNPSMIASAMSTTASKHDKHGRPIMSEGYQLNSLYPSTAFDYGAGLIEPSKALDPGLTFTSVFEDYVAFLCSIPNMDPSRVQSATGSSCNDTTLMYPTDLNLPSITVSALKGSLLARRQVTNVAGRPETYLTSVLPPTGVKVDIQPSWFTISPYGTQDLQIMLTVTNASAEFVFGEVVLSGSLDHIVRMPLSIFPVSIY